MGSGDKFNKDSNEEWSSSEIIDGVKVLVNPTDTRGNLPTYAKDSTMYARRDNSTGEIIQLRIYGEQVDGIRQPIMDIDLWGSDEHSNRRDGVVIPSDVAHSHSFAPKTQGKRKGKLGRSKNAALLTDEMITQYGNLLKKLYSRIKYK